jgi:hypothetical protein
MHVHIRTYIYINIHTLLHSFTNTCRYTHTHTYTYIHTGIQTYRHTYIHVHTHTHTQEIQLVNIEEPEGWISIPLAPNSQHNTEEKVLRAHLIQIAIMSSHQNGRDTHLRQVKIYGSRPAATKGMNTELSEFSTIDFHQFATVR